MSKQQVIHRDAEHGSRGPQRIFPNPVRKADFSSISVADSPIDNGRACKPELFIPGLKHVTGLTTNAQWRLEAETLAHHSNVASIAEDSLVAPVAGELAKGAVVPLHPNTKADLELVVAQELAHKLRYGDDVVQLYGEKLGWPTATQEIDISFTVPTGPITIEDVARYVVGEATASGTLFGDHGRLSSFSELVIGGHRADEVVHNAVALTVNDAGLKSFSRGEKERYLDALAEAIRDSFDPNRKWVEELACRLGLRGSSRNELVEKICTDPANAHGTLRACKQLLKKLYTTLDLDEFEALWSKIVRDRIQLDPLLDSFRP